MDVNRGVEKSRVEVCGTGRSAPNSPYTSENLFTSREWGFLWPISIYIGVLWFFLRTMSDLIQTILHEIFYWCVFYFDTILLIVVLLILWKIFWEMS